MLEWEDAPNPRGWLCKGLCWEGAGRTTGGSAWEEQGGFLYLRPLQSLGYWASVGAGLWCCLPQPGALGP